MSLNFISDGSNHRDEVPTFRVPQTSLFLEDSTIQVDENSTASAGDRTGICICTDIAISAYYFCILKILCTLY